MASGLTRQQQESLGGKDALLTTLEEERLHKPYSQSELAFAVRRTLEENT